MCILLFHTNCLDKEYIAYNYWINLKERIL